MDDARTELHDDDDEAPVSPARAVLTAVVMAVVLAGVAYLLVYVSSPPIRESQKEPDPHWGSACAACHRIDAAAKLIEVDE